MPASRLGGEDFLWLLGSLCQIARVPFDPALVAQEFPPPHSTVTLHEAARALGFRTGERSVTAAVLPGLTLPCIAFLRAAPAVQPAPATPTQLHVVREGEADETEAPPAEPPLRPALLIRADDRQLLYFRAGLEQPETLPLAEFDLYFEPILILTARDTPLSPAGEGPGERGRRMKQAQSPNSASAGSSPSSSGTSASGATCCSLPFPSSSSASPCRSLPR